jgi:hypothetical protein
MVAAVLALEVLFEMLPVPTSTATGYYYDPMILTYPAGHRFAVASGWNLQRAQTLRANNFGFVADHDFVPDPTAVALIGDSFVEASMLPPAERLGAQLERRIAPRRVYAMGSPGTALLDYGERMRFAAEQFGIRDFVLLLEHGDIVQSLCGSGNIHAQCLDPRSLEPRVERQPPPGTLKRVVRRFALPQYLFSQLKLDPFGWLQRQLTHLRSQLGSATQSRPATPPADATRRVITEFFARTRAYRKGKFILVWTGEATARRAASSAPDSIEVALLEAARENGAILVRTAPALRTYSARTGLSMQVSPSDGHFNGVALGVMAEEVAPLLRTDSDDR